VLCAGHGNLEEKPGDREVAGTIPWHLAEWPLYAPKKGHTQRKLLCRFSEVTLAFGDVVHGSTKGNIANDCI
jgi:hypothetical protein